MNQMEWPSLKELTAWAPMPAGYGYKLPSREDIPQLIAAVENWYPDIATGAASGYTRVQFYDEKVVLQGDDGEERLAGLHDLPELNGLASHDAVNGRHNRRVAQFELRCIEVRACLLSRG